MSVDVIRTDSKEFQSTATGRYVWIITKWYSNGRWTAWVKYKSKKGKWIKA